MTSKMGVPGMKNEVRGHSDSSCCPWNCCTGSDCDSCFRLDWAELSSINLGNASTAKCLSSDHFIDKDAVGACYLLEGFAWGGDKKFAHRALFIDIAGASTYPKGLGSIPTTWDGVIMNLCFQVKGGSLTLLAKPNFVPFLAGFSQAPFKLDWLEKVTYIGKCEFEDGCNTPVMCAQSIQDKIVLPSFWQLVGLSEPTSQQTIDSVNLDLSMYGIDLLLNTSKRPDLKWSFNFNNFSFLREVLKRLKLSTVVLEEPPTISLKELTDSICSAVWMRYQHYSAMRASLGSSME